MPPESRLRLSRRRMLGLTGLGVLTACGTPRSAEVSAGRAGAKLRTITGCVYAKNHASSPLFWSRFAPEGFRVEIKVVTSSSDVQNGLQAGHLDAGLLGPYSPLLSTDTGQPFTGKIIGMCARGGLGLIGRKGRVESVDELKGKTIGLPPAGQQNLMLDIALERAGLKRGAGVKAVPVSYADAPVALARGDVDAFISTEPQCSQSIVDGVGVRLHGLYNTPIGDFNTAIWVSPQLMSDPDAVRAVARMQQGAAEYLSPGGVNDQGRWHDLLVGQFGYTEAVFAEVLTNIGALWRFDDQRIGQVAATGAQLVAEGLLHAEPDYEEFFARDYWNR